MKVNQKGAIDIMMVAVIVTVLAVCGFALYRVIQTEDAVSTENSETQSANSESEGANNDATQDEADSATPEGWVEYKNQEFGFSVFLPSELNFSESRVDFTGDSSPGDSDGKELILSSSEVALSEEELSLPKDQRDSTDRKLYIKAATKELFKEGTGLHPASYEASIKGYSKQSEKYYIGESADSWVEIINAEPLGGTESVCGEGQHSADGGPEEYMCVFNTSLGGLVVTTFDESQFNTVKDIASTVNLL